MKQTPKVLKKKLDMVFSRYIRIEASDENGYCQCITCLKTDHYKKMQAGHYIPRHILSTRWLEINVHVQCVGCNVYGGGRLDIYALYLIKEYGVDILQTLNDKRNELLKLTPDDYLEMIDMYKGKVENLNHL